MAVFVTGGAGYIGSHTVRLFRKLGRPVVVLDSLEFGYAPAVGDAPLGVGDIADDRLVASIVAKEDVDAVVHFAGYKAAGESMRQPGRYFVNNVAGTARLLHTLQRCGVERLVFSSSCAVYGTQSAAPGDDPGAADLHSVLRGRPGAYRSIPGTSRRSHHSRSSGENPYAASTSAAGQAR